jgi:hypothetical protein
MACALGRCMKTRALNAARRGRGSLRTGEACNATVSHIVRSYFETPGLSLLVELTSVALVKLPELTLGPQILFIIP